MSKQQLKGQWIPDESKDVHGEVRGSTIFVYDSDPDEAVRTLKHEFVDYCITEQVISPFVELVNVLIKSKEAEVYRKKERLVNFFSGLL